MKQSILSAIVLLVINGTVQTQKLKRDIQFTDNQMKVKYRALDNLLDQQFGSYDKSNWKLNSGILAIPFSLLGKSYSAGRMSGRIW